MEAERKKSIAEPLSESEKHHFSFYEKQPRGYLLNKQFKERTYGDSVDFTVSAGQRAMKTDAIELGCEPSHRDSISHPDALVPSHSNVDYDANKTMK